MYMPTSPAQGFTPYAALTRPVRTVFISRTSYAFPLLLRWAMAAADVLPGAMGAADVLPGAMAGADTSPANYAHLPFPMAMEPDVVALREGVASARACISCPHLQQADQRAKSR